jgi:hypothetical protein
VGWRKIHFDQKGVSELTNMIGGESQKHVAVEINEHARYAAVKISDGSRVISAAFERACSMMLCTSSRE